MTKLQKFNNKLHLLQNKVIEDAKKLDGTLIKRVEDKHDNLKDYEIDLEIVFYLKDDDKEYVEDEDNILITLNEGIKGISTDKHQEHRWGDTNHNKLQNVNHPYIGRDEHHCWLFYRLYLYNKLSWGDILRIGSIWAEIKVHYQYCDIINQKGIR